MMAKGKLRASDIFSALYLIFMIPFVLFLILADIASLLGITTILASEFSNTSNATILWPCIFIISLSFMIPGLRRMYYRLPWLEPLIIMLAVDSVLIVCAYEIFNYGYQTVSAGRHVAFTVLAIAWLIIGRFAQCFYFSKRPIRFAGKEMLS